MLSSSSKHPKVRVSNASRIQTILAALFASLTLAGCASPLVKYEAIGGPDKSGAVKFRFAESVIKFTRQVDSKGAAASGVAITSVPVETGNVYSIEGASAWSNWGVSTDLQATYRADTKLLEQVGVTVTDNREQYVKELGSVAVAAAAFSASADLPSGLVVSKILTAPSSSTCKQLDPPRGKIVCTGYPVESAGATFTVEITIDEVPSDAVALKTAKDQTLNADSIDLFTTSYYSNSFLYSACRNATVRLLAGGRPYSDAVSVVVADPRYVETLRFPDKGKIMVGASCGASSSAEDAKLPDALSFVDTLLSTAKTTKDNLSTKSKAKP